MNFEGRMKKVILEVIEQPVNNIRLLEDLVHKYAETTRKNVRRTHELEFVVEKFMREASNSESYDGKFKDFELKLANQMTNVEA